jgi:hypothetical protein
VQQQPQSVIVEIAEAVPDPLHLLDEQVDGLGGSIGAAVGGMPSEDLGLPDPYGASQTGQLGDLDAISRAVRRHSWEPPLPRASTSWSTAA